MSVIRKASIKTLSIIATLFATYAIFVFVLYLNVPGKAVDRDDTGSQVSFSVEKPPEPPKPTPEPPQQLTESIPPPPMPPMAAISDNLSGIDLGINFSQVDVDTRINDALIGDVSNIVMTGDTVDEKPSPTFRVPFEYPARAKAKEIEGFVVLSLLIDQKGEVKKIKVLESEPVGVFDEPAIQSVKDWRFTPAKFKGSPVKIWANQTIRFELG